MKPPLAKFWFAQQSWKTTLPLMMARRIGAAWETDHISAELSQPAPNGSGVGGS
jgi:hypothetical protein